MVWNYTIFFHSFNTLLLTSSIYLSEYSYIPYYIAFIFCVMASYFSFTVMHEGSHNSICKNTIVNDVIGIMSSILVSPFSSFYAFKYIHKHHHIHVNTHLDPDFWISHSKTFPIMQSILQIPYYYVYIIRRYINGKMRYYLFLVCLYQVVIVTLTFSTMFALKFYYSLSIIYYYIFLPSIISVPILSFMLTYIPHRNEGPGKYENTSIIQIEFIPEFITNIIMCNQNYHIIHHLNPSIPFYNYQSYYRDKSKIENVRKKSISLFDIPYLYN